MTGVLLTTIACLLMLCAVLVVLLIGRDRGAQREENRLHQIAAGLAEQLATERQKVRHLQERNAELRDELDAAADLQADPLMTVEVTAWLADLPLTHPEDLR